MCSYCVQEPTNTQNISTTSADATKCQMENHVCHSWLPRFIESLNVMLCIKRICKGWKYRENVTSFAPNNMPCNIWLCKVCELRTASKIVSYLFRWCIYKCTLPVFWMIASYIYNTSLIFVLWYTGLFYIISVNMSADLC